VSGLLTASYFLIKTTLKTANCIIFRDHTRAHGFKLPPKDDRNFISRLLFKDMHKLNLNLLL